MINRYRKSPETSADENATRLSFRPYDNAALKFSAASGTKVLFAGLGARAAAQPSNGLSPAKWRICPIHLDACAFICEYSYRSNSFNLQRHPLAAWAFVHVAVRFNELAERKHRGLQRYQHAVGGQLVDITQRALQRHLVLGDAQLRLAGEIADTVHKELNVLLERCTGRERCLVAALQAIQHRAAV